MKKVVVVLIMLCIYTSFNDNDNEENLIEDYIIFNQISHHLTDYGHFIFYNPCVYFDERISDSQMDSSYFFKIINILKSYGIDTKDFDIRRLKVKIVPDVLWGFEMDGYLEKENIPFETKFINTGKNVAIIKSSEYAKYLKEYADKYKDNDVYKHVSFGLSRIQFNRERTEGVFKISYNYAPFAGGDIVKIRKINGILAIISCEKEWIT